MNRSELIKNLATRFPHLLLNDTDFAVRVILEGIGGALARGDRVEIRGFGRFALTYRSPRTGRNPKTGETVLIPTKRMPHFKAGKALRERVEESLTREKTISAPFDGQ